MKKLWEIVVSDKVEPGVQKKIKRLLRPVNSVGRPWPCLFCDIETTWTINNQAVCPSCSVKYGFASKDRIPDACEICGKQGEWCTEGKPIHSLCFGHRDEWLHWEQPELRHIDSTKQPKRWLKAWDECWARFVACMKEKASV